MIWTDQAVTEYMNKMYGEFTPVLRNHERPVIGSFPDGAEIYFESINEAERLTGIPKGSISECCRHRRNTTRGVKWQFAV